MNRTRSTDRILRFSDSLSRFTGTIAGFVVAGLMVAMSMDAISRNLSGGSIPGVVEFSEIAVVVIIYFSLGYGQLAKSHVAVDILIDHLPPRVAAIWNSLVLLTIGVLLAWMSVESVEPAIRSWSTGEYRFGLLAVPMWPGRFAIALGFGVFAIQCLADAWREYAGSRNVTAVSDEPTAQDAI